MVKKSPILVAADHKIAVAKGLRNWQKRAASLRCSLSALATQLGINVNELRSMMKKGPRSTLRRAESKKQFIGVAKKVCEPPAPFPRCKRRSTQTCAAALKTLRESGLVLTLGDRHSRRLAQKMRSKRRKIEQKQAKTWHKNHPNEGITDDQWRSLCSQSSHW